jgi:hypothetical protein
VNAELAGRPRLVAGLRLVRLVGSGGEGEVWESRDELGRRRALKLIRPDALAIDAEDRSRHLLAIDHPALVRVYDGGRFSDGPLAGWGYLEMAFVDGPSLHDAPPDAAVLDRLWPLAEALDLLHAGEWTEGLALVHRDVKPANLVEDPHGEIVLVDPSTLRGLDATQLTRIGTPVFSAPEVMTGRFGPPADVYSFAATVVALLTGARGEHLAALLDEAHTLDLPAGVAYALSPVPGDRPAFCADVLEAGAELADDTTVFLPGPADERSMGLGYAAQPGYPDEGSELSPEPGAGQGVELRRRRLWPWVWWFVLLVALPGAAAVSEALPSTATAPLLLAILAGHLLASVSARVSLPLAVLVPPVAWGVLLGRRVVGGRRRVAWASAVFSAAMAPATAAVVLLLRGAASPELLLVAILVTVLLVVVTAAATTAHGGAGVLLRLLLTPLWVIGAVVLIGGGMLLAPFGLARGTVWSTATSLLDGIRPPAMMRATETPTWR